MSAAEAPGFQRAALASAGTGALFLLLYNLCNAYAAGSGRLRQWYWDWELAIPRLDWAILPYWSIDLLFALAPFLCTRRGELRALAGRLVLSMLLAGACFVAWPLEPAFARTPAEGVWGPLFAAIHAFDRPHNLFPSLHIAFAGILLLIYHRHVPGRWRWPLHGWFALIVASTVLVHQHHVVDLIGGALLAVLCCYLVPEEPLPAAPVRMDRRGAVLGARHLAAAALALAAAWWLGGWAWLLVWPALAFALQAAAHLGLGAAIWGKRTDGVPWAARLVLAPWLLPLAWSRRCWWRRDAAGAVPVADGVWLGRLPTAERLRQHGIRAILDLTAEHDGSRGEGLMVERLPMLDLATPAPAALRAAAAAIERLRPAGPVLVHCALGYGRSATAVAAWLLLTRRAATPADAVALVAAARPGAQVPAAALAGLAMTPPAAG